MRHIVQTAYETLRHNKHDDTTTVIMTGKVTIPCVDANEAQVIANGMNGGDRKAWAGVELYTQGGVKVILSYDDVRDIARVARSIGPALTSADAA